IHVNDNQVRRAAMKSRHALTAAPSVLVLLLAGASGGCTPEGGGTGGATPGSSKKSIQNIGSDTMVNLALAWAEAYHKVNPEVSVQVSGGGSGVGISALEAGTVDIANSSRPSEPEEAKKAKETTGKDPKETETGYDGLAVYVHKDNPLETISIEVLAEIYGEGGKTDKWSQLGTKNPMCSSDEIIRVSRQSSSGT